jgi:hypothetical protein
MGMLDAAKIRVCRVVYTDAADWLLRYCLAAQAGSPYPSFSMTGSSGRSHGVKRRKIKWGGQNGSRGNANLLR